MEEPKAATSKMHLTVIPKQTFLEKLLSVIAIIMLILFPLVLALCFKVVKQYKRAIILRFGKLRSDCPAGPGIIWVIPYTDFVFEVDLRTQLLNLPSQEILTRDSVTVRVDALVYYHVLNPLKSSMNVQSYSFSTKMISVALLRNVIGQHTLSDLLTGRDSISRFTKSEIDKVTIAWGVQLERLEIKEVLLPVELQKAMAAEAEGTRIAKAKIIEAKGEIKTAENLKDASKIIVDNPHVMLMPRIRKFGRKNLSKGANKIREVLESNQEVSVDDDEQHQILLLRYLQTLNQIAAQQSTSILFPFPIEIPDSMPQFQQGITIKMSKDANETDPQKNTEAEGGTNLKKNATVESSEGSPSALTQAEATEGSKAAPSEQENKVTATEGSTTPSKQDDTQKGTKESTSPSEQESKNKVPEGSTSLSEQDKVKPTDGSAAPSEQDNKVKPTEGSTAPSKQENKVQGTEVTTAPSEQDNKVTATERSTAPSEQDDTQKGTKESTSPSEEENKNKVPEGRTSLSEQDKVKPTDGSAAPSEQDNKVKPTEGSTAPSKQENEVQVMKVTTAPSKQDNKDKPLEDSTAPTRNDNTEKAKDYSTPVSKQENKDIAGNVSKDIASRQSDSNDQRKSNLVSTQPDAEQSSSDAEPEDYCDCAEALMAGRFSARSIKSKVEEDHKVQINSKTTAINPPKPKKEPSNETKEEQIHN